MERLSTHVLDTYHGSPAAELEVCLERISATGTVTNIFRGTTAADGRLILHSGPDPLPASRYRLLFETGLWFARRGLTCRFPRVVLHFESRPGASYHLPLYIGPHSFTTYRGS